MYILKTKICLNCKLTIHYFPQVLSVIENWCEKVFRILVAGSTSVMLHLEWFLVLTPFRAFCAFNQTHTKKLKYNEYFSVYCHLSRVSRSNDCKWSCNEVYCVASGNYSELQDQVVSHPIVLWSLSEHTTCKRTYGIWNGSYFGNNQMYFSSKFRLQPMCGKYCYTFTKKTRYNPLRKRK